MTFDPTKPVRTRDGRKARIICTDMISIGSVGGASILALVLSDNREMICAYKPDGTCYICNTALDLVNVPQKHVVFWNIYPDDFHDFLDTKKEADKCAVPGRIACLRIEFEEGEGL